MEPLENILKKVEDLRRDLSAEIVVYQLRIIAPDTQKREAARAELRKIYDSSPWCSASYVAGQTLNKYSHEKFNLWMRGLIQGLAATKEVKRDVEVGGDYKEKGDNYIFWEVWSPKLENLTFIEIDEEKRLDAIKDARRLFELVKHSKCLSSEEIVLQHLLENTYKENVVKAVQSEAGKALGYSQPRIWLHDKNNLHNAASVIGGVILAGTSYGIYTLIENWFK